MTDPEAVHEKWRDFDVRDAAMLASCLRQDQETCKAGLRPSPLALFLPPATSPLADAISTHLATKDGNGDAPFVPKAVRKMWYTSILQSLKDHLATSTAIPTKNAHNATTSLVLSRRDLEGAVKVLRYLQSSPNTPGLSGQSCVDQVIPVLQAELAVRSGNRQSSQKANPLQDLRKCYICRFIISTPHPNYPALCNPCGSFNVAESSLSSPHNLHLASKTALVTGGRVNLGFYCALRLLRCGARTVVSTRYPLDAEARYCAEPDYKDWKDRLRIVGADFRTSKDAFQLVLAVKAILREWNEGEEESQLFLLVNNAAQTITDSIEAETVAVQREENLRSLLDSGHSEVAYSGDYRARIRGGLLGSMLEGGYQETEGETNSVSKAVVQKKSSWIQSLSEIPYEDIINAQSVNAFVPLILCRELLPLMGSNSCRTRSSPSVGSSRSADSDFLGSDAPSDKPLGYIVNVSSREGIFESRPGARSKFGYHVHTNMSKAALNMLTETESGRMWQTRRVAMNTVDPGYMSAAPEYRSRFPECPIGFEDGAARILWPVAVGEKKGVPVWGRFLKHFGKVEVEVGLGR